MITEGLNYLKKLIPTCRGGDPGEDFDLGDAQCNTPPDFVPSHFQKEKVEKKKKERDGEKRRKKRKEDKRTFVPIFSAISTPFVKSSKNVDFVRALRKDWSIQVHFMFN